MNVTVGINFAVENYEAGQDMVKSIKKHVKSLIQAKAKQIIRKKNSRTTRPKEYTSDEPFNWSYK